VEARRAESAIAAERDPRPASAGGGGDAGGDRAPDRGGGDVVEVAVGDAADVVLAEE
jgi:hypothetical protein